MHNKWNVWRATKGNWFYLCTVQCETKEEAEIAAGYRFGITTENAVCAYPHIDNKEFNSSK